MDISISVSVFGMLASSSLVFVFSFLVRCVFKGLRFLVWRWWVWLDGEEVEVEEVEEMEDAEEVGDAEIVEKEAKKAKKSNLAASSPPTTTSAKSVENRRSLLLLPEISLGPWLMVDAFLAEVERNLGAVDAES